MGRRSLNSLRSSELRMVVWPGPLKTRSPRSLFAEMMQFRTRRGNLLLYTPHSLDSWIGKDIQEDEDNGGHKDATTVKPLSNRLATSYKAFCKRHSERCRMEDKVDKCIRLVDKYQPRVFAEARIYVARFPGQVGELLRQIKKVRKRIRKARGTRRRQRTADPSSSGRAAVPEAAQCVQPTGGVLLEDPQSEGPAQVPQPEHETKGSGEDPSGRKESLDTDTPPDWGNSSEDDAEQPLHSWPWGDFGRPSDRGDSLSHFALRPSEPTGSPPLPRWQAQQPDCPVAEGGRVHLVPNVQWRGVQQVQEHMARARADRQSL